MNKSKLLMGAAALANASLAFADAAQANTQVFGGGASLVGPYLRQAEDCFGNPHPLVVQGPYPYGAGSETFLSPPLFNYTGTPAHNCASGPVSPTSDIFYISSSSGNGELGVITHDVTIDVGTTNDGGNVQFPSIQYGLGDYGIDYNEVGVYKNGGVLSQKTGGNQTATISPGTGGTLTYANPVPLYGNFIQVPFAIDPVAIAFPSTYAIDNTSGVPVAYHLNIHTPNADGSGGLVLDMKSVCAIANGVITNLNDPALKALNGGVSLQDPADLTTFNVPIKLVGRADSAGTTAIYARALAAQCNPTSSGYTGVNYFPASGAKKLPAAVLPGGASPNPFTTFTGSAAVATYTSAAIPTPPAGSETVQFRLAFLGTDYVLPASAINGLPFNLSVANIKLSKSVILEPTAKNALASFGTGLNALLPPQSDGSGHYAAGNTAHGLRANPEDWGEPISTTFSYDHGVTFHNTPLADPNHNITGVTKGYPIVATTNLFLNTCFNGAPVTSTLNAFLTYLYTAPLVQKSGTGLLAVSGQAPLPPAWLTAAYHTFLNPAKEPITTRAALQALNLNILQAGTGPVSGTGSQCNAVSPGA